MRQEPPVVRQRRSVGRGPKVRASVLSATIATLAEAGYADLTVDAVAQRAGVHKTTVYRRWGDRESLVADALTELALVDVPIPDTGTIEADLREYARALVRFLTSTTGQALLAAMLSDSGRIQGIAVVKRRFFDARFRQAGPVVARAIERGQLPNDTDPAELVMALVAPIYFRLLIAAAPVDESTADLAAQVALAAAQAGALQHGPPSITRFKVLELTDVVYTIGPQANEEDR